MKFGLSQTTIDQIKQVLGRSMKIERVVIYGSRALGRHRHGSDIDLSLIGPRLTSADLLTLQTQLDELPIPYTVDLSVYHLIDNPNLRDHIDRVGQEF